MNNFAILLIGDLQRIKRYNILAATLFVIALWIGALQLTGVEDVSRIFPLLILLDATSMAILMIGVTIFFEKQEGVLRTLLVSPISKGEYLLAKIMSNIVLNVGALYVLYAYIKIFKEIHINIFILTMALILVTLFHALVGLVFTMYAKDFTSLIASMMKYFMIAMVPVLLVELQVITGDWFAKIIYLVPTKASMVLINASIGEAMLWEILLSVGYLVVASFLLYIYVIKKFNAFAVKESGM